MASLTPLVLEGFTLPEFIRYVIDKHAQPSTLIVCSTKEAFLQQLHDALTEPSPEPDETERPAWDETRIEALIRLWSTPTLRLLASSRSVKMVFCPDVTHLRACLAAYGYRTSKEIGQPKRPWSPRFQTSRLLAVLNPVQLHKSTSSFSAQGINRTLAVAVEAAHHSKSRLILAECPTEAANLPSEELTNFEGQSARQMSNVESSWDEEVSILNVTTKSFGASERGWVGRTVKVRTIAERWGVLQKMDTAGD